MIDNQLNAALLVAVAGLLCAAVADEARRGDANVVAAARTATSPVLASAAGTRIAPEPAAMTPQASARTAGASPDAGPARVAGGRVDRASLAWAR